MSEKAKASWVVVIVLLLGIAIGAGANEIAHPGDTVVEVEVCAEFPTPPEVVIPACPEAPDCVLVETPCPEIPPAPPCVCAKDTEYGCLHSLRPEVKETKPVWNRPDGTVK